MLKNDTSIHTVFPKIFKIIVGEDLFRSESCRHQKCNQIRSAGQGIGRRLYSIAYVWPERKSLVKKRIEDNHLQSSDRKKIETPS